MMTDDNKKAIYALAQNFPQESVKMMEIAHKASKKYKQDLDSLAAQQQQKQKRQLESRVHDIVTKNAVLYPTRDPLFMLLPSKRQIRFFLTLPTRVRQP